MEIKIIMYFMYLPVDRQIKLKRYEMYVPYSIQGFDWSIFIR